ncbi:GNAT family N-acetyltransferase [Labedaea rhizosphaerae]|uniref:RimJ/RimL family protein N-acetyltransferase n=1 Tax=Labedaea rhizosphaerae TaxID=598644 RepID=A0A4V6PVQ1_LABRH|nr:GNAT family N-acetyltransferase [Labedaea rhizosphaerae]TDP93638.1 RimJ/RimL family protein N-acetyltransferase [Labedaea rhizosphaerae]
MEPIEINAGLFYLRGLRADELIDDRPALAEAFADESIRQVVQAADPDVYIGMRAQQWADESGCSWAVAEPTTGRLLGEAGLVIEAEGARAYCWTLPGERGKGVASTALGAVLRFGRGALDLVTIRFRHPVGEQAASHVAKSCGLVRDDQALVTIGDVEFTQWHVTVN